MDAAGVLEVLALARCLEIEPRYVDVALARWEYSTGRPAERIE